MTGPTLRAAGVAYDNRKAFPYSSYEEFNLTCRRGRNRTATRGTWFAWRKMARKPEDHPPGAGQDFE